MSSGILQNQFIEFTNDLLLLTGGTAIRSIYVRESYETVTKLIADKMIKEGVKRFVVTGTPGIGKTIYLHTSYGCYSQDRLVLIIMLRERYISSQSMGGYTPFKVIKQCP